MTAPQVTKLKRLPLKDSNQHQNIQLIDAPQLPQAAGVIHTDFEKGFIRAETISYDDMKKSGSEKAVKEAGLLRSEGRDYVMKEGDIVLFRFNV